jgi:hypothetical protein
LSGLPRQTTERFPSLCRYDIGKDAMIGFNCANIFNELIVFLQIVKV